MNKTRVLLGTTCKPLWVCMQVMLTWLIGAERVCQDATRSQSLRVREVDEDGERRRRGSIIIDGVADGRAEKLRMGNRQEGARDLELAMID